MSAAAGCSGPSGTGDGPIVTFAVDMPEPWRWGIPLLGNALGTLSATTPKTRGNHESHGGGRAPSTPQRR